MLTIDIGNSSLKWAAWDANHITSTGECLHQSVFDTQLFESSLPELQSFDKIWVANVAGENATAGLENYLAQVWLNDKDTTELIFFKTQKKCCGVVNAYGNPSEHGVDRWAALIAARSLCKTNVCVIGLGTAVTIDIMNDAGEHEGGMIMPGLKMMQQSLLDNTSDVLFGVEEISKQQGFATTTQKAVQSGTLELLLAGLNDVCSQVIKRYGENTTIFLTGGLAVNMLPLLVERNIIHEPYLVLRGLRLAADD